MRHRSRRFSTYKGSGVISTLTGAAGTVLNKAIDLLPVELHLPGYQYCGPGTNLKLRLQRGDPGINKLDIACKDHDIAYANFSDNEKRRIADTVLANKAWERVKAHDSSLGERTAAWAVTNLMKVKSKIGAGKRQNKTLVKKKKCVKSRTTKNERKHKNKRSGKGLRLKPYSGSGHCKKKCCTRHK